MNTADPTQQRREFTLQEIQQFYAPRYVYEGEGAFVIKPLNRAEGSVRLAIPRTLRVNDKGQLIDPTLTFPDKERILCHEMGLICTDMIYAHLGHCSQISRQRKTKPNVYQLLLDDYSHANALRLEIHYNNIPAWGHHHQPLAVEKLPGEVLLHESQPLNGLHWIDFWLIRIDDQLQKFRSAYQKYQEARQQ